MTQQKHLKALIRARMAKTGERYAAARAHIVDQPTLPTLQAGPVFKAHDRHCMTAVFLADDAGLVSGGFGGQARIWDLDGGMVGELVGHESSVNAIEISPDGRRAVTASSDKTVRLWDLPARAQIAELGRHRRQVTALGFDHIGDSVWSGAHDGKAHRWDAATGELLATVDLGSSVTGLALDPAGERVAATTGAGGVLILDAASGDVLARPGEESLAYSVRWASDGSFLMAAANGEAKVWATDEWELIRKLVPLGPGVMPIALSPDGSQIAMGWDNHVGLWTSHDEAPAVVIDGLPKGVYGLEFSHSGSSLVLAAADGRVRSWEIT